MWRPTGLSLLSSLCDPSPHESLIVRNHCRIVTQGLEKAFGVQWGSWEFPGEHVYSKKKKMFKTFAKRAVSSILSFHEPIFSEQASSSKSSQRTLSHEAAKLCVQVSNVSLCISVKTCPLPTISIGFLLRIKDYFQIDFFLNWFPCLLESSYNLQWLPWPLAHKADTNSMGQSWVYHILQW